MQLLTPDQEMLFKELIPSLVVGVVGYAFKVWLNSVRKIVLEQFNKIITDNVNRNKIELQTHFDAKKLELTNHIDIKFKEHENTAFGQLGQLKVELASTQAEVMELHKKFDEIIKVLNNFKG